MNDPEIEKIDCAFNEISRLIDAGNPDEASIELEKWKPKKGSIKHQKIRYPITLIHLGKGKKNKDIVSEGIVLCKNQANGNKMPGHYYYELYYAIANGYSFIMQQELKEKPTNDYLTMHEKYLREMKANYESSIEHFDGMNKIRENACLLEYANCLSSSGRCIEAISIYQQLVENQSSDPYLPINYAVALFQLVFTSSVSDMELTSFLFFLFDFAYKSAGRIIPEEEANKVRNTCVMQVQTLIATYGNRVMYPSWREQHPIDMANRTNFEADYIDFCSIHKLYLNMHIFEKQGERAIEDTISLPPALRSNRANEMARYINEIKEDYVTARLVLIRSQIRSTDITWINSKTIYSNVENLHYDLEIGLLKNAYQSAFNILDKVGVLIKIALDIPISDNAVNFTCDYRVEDADKRSTSRSIWKNEEGNIRREIRSEINSAERNYSLLGLYDIFLDTSSDFRLFEDIRNAIAHRKLDIVSEDIDYSADIGIGKKKLIERTIKLFQLVRATIIYLINFIYIRESRNIQTTVE